MSIGQVFHKRRVTRVVLFVGHGQVQYRETYLDGFTRVGWSYEGQWRRWLNGAAEGPAQRRGAKA